LKADPTMTEPAHPGAGGPTDLLTVDNVTLQYKTPQHLVTATYKVGFSVQQSERYVILGPSGCGKSTLLKAIGGFMAPVTGKITIGGRPVTGPGPDRMMVFQEFEQLMPWKTVLQNTEFPMRATGKFGRTEARERAIAMIDRVKLGKFRDVYPHMLSGGMKMRVALARAMALEPSVLLMDEPFAALDALTRREMQEELLGLWEQFRFTVLFVTHSIEEAIFLADRVVVMSPGPGRIDNEYSIDLPRPRDIASPEFNEWRRLLSSQLHSHHGRKAG